MRKYPLDIIKSSVHKYIRRNNKDMFMRSILELYLICNENKEFKPLIERIKIICAEEILFVHCNKIIQIHNLLDKFVLFPRGGKFILDTNYNYIIDCVNILTSCRRTRLSKYILGYYSLGIDYKLYSLEEHKLKPLIAPLKKEKDSEELVDTVNKFYTLFKSSHYDCFYYALKTFYKLGCGNIRFGNKRKATYFIWEILLYEIKQLKPFNDKLYQYCIVLLKSFHLPCTYKPMYLIQAILAFFHKDKLDYEEFKIEEINYKKIMDRHQRIYFKIDLFCIDVHTKLGRKWGKTKDDFMNDGRIVIDEDLEYVNSKIVDIYDKALRKYHQIKNKLA